MAKECRKIRGRKVCGPFCGPGTSYPADVERRAVNAISRAATHLRGRARDKVQRCACRILKRKYDRVTPRCETLGF